VHCRDDALEASWGPSRLAGRGILPRDRENVKVVSELLGHEPGRCLPADEAQGEPSIR
jgi:hypothetical protein